MSTSDRADRVRALFDEVVGLSPEERDERLTAAFGDDAGMRNEVEALLAAADADASDMRRALDALRPEGSVSGDALEPAGRPEPPTDLRDALAERYRLEGEIGRGGMATVYLAEDVRHHRKVAVKVFDPDLGATIGADRFLREIETAANLTHPHILPLHDSGQVDGFLYYVMPFVEGESLRARLDRETQLPVEEAVRITAEIRPGPPLAVVERRVLFGVPGGFYFGGQYRYLQVTNDDRRFLMAREVETAEEQTQGELILIQNFFEEVKRLVGK